MRTRTIIRWVAFAAVLAGLTALAGNAGAQTTTPAERVRVEGIIAAMVSAPRQQNYPGMLRFDVVQDSGAEMTVDACPRIRAAYKPGDYSLGDRIRASGTIDDSTGLPILESCDITLVSRALAEAPPPAVPEYRYEPARQYAVGQDYYPYGYSYEPYPIFYGTSPFLFGFNCLPYDHGYLFRHRYDGDFDRDDFGRGGREFHHGTGGWNGAGGTGMHRAGGFATPTVTRPPTVLHGGAASPDVPGRSVLFHGPFGPSRGPNIMGSAVIHHGPFSARPTISSPTTTSAPPRTWTHSSETRHGATSYTYRPTYHPSATVHSAPAWHGSPGVRFHEGGTSGGMRHR